MPTYESLPAQSDYFKGRLYQKLVDDLRLAGKAKRTVYGYVRAVRKLADFHEKSPDKIAEQHVREYLLHLMWIWKWPQARKVSYCPASSSSIALRFHENGKSWIKPRSTTAVHYRK